MKSQYRVVVIGGGVVGASVLYHLAKLGWSDVAIVERKVLTAGSTWHAAGGVHALNADPNIAALQAYTIDLLSEIEQEIRPGHRHAHDRRHLWWHRRPSGGSGCRPPTAIFQTMGIEDVRLMDAGRDQGMVPDHQPRRGPRRAVGRPRGLHRPVGTSCMPMPRPPGMRGAEVIEHNRVLELNQRPDGYWDVVTEQGTIVAEHVVNAAGLWAKQVGRMAGVELPLSPLAHHYLVTERSPNWRRSDLEMPMMIDLEGFTYMRQELKGLLVGIYEVNHKHWNMDGAPVGLRPRADPARRRPHLRRTGDGHVPLPGPRTRPGSSAGSTAPSPSPPTATRWSARCPGCATTGRPAAVMAGFLQGGGVGKSLAEWMIHGEPEDDIFGMDVARYGSFAANREYIRQMTGQFYSRRFVMTYPNEQLSAGRPLRMAPAYDAMTAAGAHWGSSWGLEVPLYFAPREFSRDPDARRSNAFDIVGEECRARAIGSRHPRHLRLLPLRGDRAERPSSGSTIFSPAVCPSPGRLDWRRCWATTAASRATSPSSTGATAPGGSWAPTTSGRGTCAGSTST